MPPTQRNRARSLTKTEVPPKLTHLPTLHRFFNRCSLLRDSFFVLVHSCPSPLVRTERLVGGISVCSDEKKKKKHQRVQDTSALESLGRRKHGQVSKCRECALTKTSTLWIYRPDSHKLKPETHWFPQVMVPSTAPHNEAHRSWTCRHLSRERCPGPFRCSLAVNCV